jgi:hypothetical protein
VRSLSDGLEKRVKQDDWQEFPRAVHAREFFQNFSFCELTPST